VGEGLGLKIFYKLSHRCSGRASLLAYLPLKNWPEKQKTHSACEWVESFRFVALATNSPLAQFLVGTKS
jgi:hypothetical protein